MSLKTDECVKEYRRKEFNYDDQCKEKTFDLKGVKVLAKTDWERIQYNLHKRSLAEQAEVREREKKEAIRECSQNLLKNWTNTVLKGSGARQKKLAQRKARLEEEEEARKKLDVEEARIQAEKRRKAIEEAKIKQYYETDRVKNFHSALLYSEVIKEREAQIELKRMKELSQCNRDSWYVAKAKREYEEALRADQEREAEKRRKTVANTEFLKTQIKHNKEVREKKYQDHLADGAEIRRIVAEHMVEKQRVDRIDFEEQRAQAQENLRQIDNVKLMRQINKLVDEEDNDEIRVFAAAKKKLMRLRLQREAEMQNEKQENLDRIKNLLMAQLKAKMDDEDLRIKNAVTEKEEKFLSDEAEKNQKRADYQKSIDEHRHQTMNRLDQERRDIKHREVDELLRRKEEDVVLKKYEAERQSLKRAEMRKLALENWDISRKMKEDDEFSRGNQLKLNDENQKLLDLEEKVFQEYAQKVIEHCAKGHRNLHPLLAAVNKGMGGGAGPKLHGGVPAPNQTTDGKYDEEPNCQNTRTQVMHGVTPTNDQAP